jgi:hypothetical protein
MCELVCPRRYIHASCKRGCVYVFVRAKMYRYACVCVKTCMLVGMCACVIMCKCSVVRNYVRFGGSAYVQLSAYVR